MRSGWWWRNSASILGVIEKPVYAIVVFMAVATTLIAPVFLSITFRGEQQSSREEQFQIG